MERTRITKKEGGQWPENTKAVPCSFKRCPQPLLDAMAGVRAKSRQYRDGRFNSIQEVHNEALRVGMEVLERSYERKDVAAAKVLMGDRRRGRG